MKKTEKKSHKVDIFQVLGHIDQKDRHYYESLPDDQKKALQPYVVMRWLSGTKEARQVYFINELVNPFTFAFITNHKELLYYLMTVCTTGKKKRYYWNKTNSKKRTSLPSTVSVLRQYFGYSTVEALDILPLLSDDDVLEYAEQVGTQPDEIKKIKKELKEKRTK